MTSIYQLAMGKAFDQLHPCIQARFGFSSQDRLASIGQGVMDRIWYAKWAAAPLMLGTTRHIMFPQGGRGIPFHIANFAYRDSYGRETVTWLRTFKFPRKIRKFDATMIYSGARDRIVDYLGNKQHLAVDLDLSVADNGGLRIRSTDQRFYEGRLGFAFPKLFTGEADVCEWYDDEDACYRISVRVRNPLLGLVFAYDGRFQTHFVEMDQGRIPLEAKPLREEWRE
ncbi:hypothetical protein FHS18_002358 [Paenibacillus phyllosphaerae]|uniref:DUF4166 domain-containing protein n=1 Tax=Paenibacillus phyllosphaerae TaxID=274593 RepID=A0A7W5FMI0_9BACL|nr:DUF4166 domain-containing protein [Paenibacillus phyllosphaerae]MBB3110291.1 hypothetical protein [Paenibacillus phyllosphaerae]